MTKCFETKAFYLILESSDAKIGLKLMKNENRARSGGKTNIKVGHYVCHLATMYCVVIINTSLTCWAICAAWICWEGAGWL